MMWPGDEGNEGENAEPETEDTFEAEEQLTLADEDDALPWLESDEEYEDEGSDYRILIFGLLAVGLLAVILIGGNYLLGGGSGSQATPDGSTIAASDVPYKSRPEDPGGSEVEGTGDVSFQVGEGQSSEGQLADGAPAPSINLDQDGQAQSPSSNGVGVQVGAFSSRESARNGWNQLRGRYQALQGMEHRIIEGTADSGTIYRLQAVAANAGAADSVCRSIRAAGGDCQVKR